MRVIIWFVVQGGKNLWLDNKHHGGRAEERRTSSLVWALDGYPSHCSRGASMHLRRFYCIRVLAACPLRKKMTSPSPLFLDYLEVAVAALELGWLSYYDVYTLYLSTLMCISVLVRYIPLTNR